MRLEHLQAEDARWISDSYYVTEEIEAHLSALRTLFARDEGCGIFLIGHYGSGKSHFLAYLAQQLHSKTFAAAQPRRGPGVAPELPGRPAARVDPAARAAAPRDRAGPARSLEARGAALSGGPAARRRRALGVPALETLGRRPSTRISVSCSSSASGPRDTGSGSLPRCRSRSSTRARSSTTSSARSRTATRSGCC